MRPMSLSTRGAIIAKMNKAGKREPLHDFHCPARTDPNAKCDPSCDVSRAKASKATDLEPIPVEDAEQERKDLPHGFKPTPDSIFCRVCGKAGTNPLHYKPVKTFPSRRDAGYADDSVKRDRLHRALDAVMDSVK